MGGHAVEVGRVRGFFVLPTGLHFVLRDRGYFRGMRSGAADDSGALGRANLSPRESAGNAIVG